MLDALPRRALLRFEIPVRYLERAPRIDGHVGKWSARYRAPALSELDDESPFAEVFWGWNEAGFYFAYQVQDKSGAPQCDLERWWSKDGARLCIDTRDARENKRATRYCHFFYFLPAGGGRDRKQPVVGMHRMSRSKEPPPVVDTSLIQVATHARRGAYSLEAAIPAACLSGFSPAEHPRIGLFFKIKDVHFGGQHLSATDDLGWNADPSTWATGVLLRE